MPGPESSGEEPSVGLLGDIAIGIGGMVGGGIFAVLGVAATQAGGATPVAFLVAGAIAALTAFSYARLSVRFRSSGGTVTFVDRAFGVGELTGSLNIVLWTGYIVTTALYASAFGSYAVTFLPGGTDPHPLLVRILIAAGVLIPWLINLAKASLVARSESAIVVIKLVILTVVIVAGVSAVSPDRLSPATWPSPLSVIAAGMLIFVAYEGFELIANASADTRRPLKNLPRAFGLSVGLVIVLYVVIAAITVGSLTSDQISKAADYALAEVASGSLGGFGFSLVAASAVLATFSAINATLYGSARLSYTIATEGELPHGFERMKWNQPIGLHITALGALILAVAIPVGAISAMASAIFLAVFAVVNAAELKTEPSPGWPRLLAGVGAVGCLASLLVLVTSSVAESPQSMALLAILVAVALVLEHRVLRHRRPGPIRLSNGADPD